MSEGKYSRKFDKAAFNGDKPSPREEAVNSRLSRDGNSQSSRNGNGNSQSSREGRSISERDDSRFSGEESGEKSLSRSTSRERSNSHEQSFVSGGPRKRHSSVERRHSSSSNRFGSGDDHHKSNLLHKSPRRKSSWRERKEDERDEETPRRDEGSHCRSDFCGDTSYDGGDEFGDWTHHCRSCGVPQKTKCGKCQHHVRPEHYCCKCGTYCNKMQAKAVHTFEEKVSVRNPCTGQTQVEKYKKEDIYRGQLHIAGGYSKEQTLSKQNIDSYNKYADKMGFPRINGNGTGK